MTLQVSEKQGFRIPKCRTKKGRRWEHRSQEAALLPRGGILFCNYSATIDTAARMFGFNWRAIAVSRKFMGSSMPSLASRSRQSAWRDDGSGCFWRSGKNLPLPSSRQSCRDPAPKAAARWLGELAFRQMAGSIRRRVLALGLRALACYLTRPSRNQKDCQKYVWLGSSGASPQSAACDFRGLAPLDPSHPCSKFLMRFVQNFTDEGLHPLLTTYTLSQPGKSGTKKVDERVHFLRFSNLLIVLSRIFRESD